MRWNDIKPNFNEKVLRVAFSLKGKKKERGVVVNLCSVYSEVNPYAGELYKKFLERGEYEYVEINTRQGPGELTGNLVKKFKLFSPIHVGGMIGLLDSTLPEARKVLADLRKNPQRYYDSPEEKAYNHGDFNSLFLGFAFGNALKNK